MPFIFFLSWSHFHCITCTLYLLQPLAMENTDRSLLLKRASVLSADFSNSRLIKICQWERELISSFNTFMLEETFCCGCWSASISVWSYFLDVQDVGNHTSCWSPTTCLYQTTLHFPTNTAIHWSHSIEAVAWQDPSPFWQEMTGLIGDPTGPHLFKMTPAFLSIPPAVSADLEGDSYRSKIPPKAVHAQ